MKKEINVGDVIEVKIEKIVPGGYGLAFTEGATAFVALAAPGDELRAKVVKVKGKTVFAEAKDILKQGQGRVDPPCRYFGSCGGCDFQQLGYAEQLKAKEAIIRDCLERIGKIVYDDNIRMIASPEPFGYRLRAQWHVDTDAKKIGYYRRDSRDLVEIDECAVLQPELRNRLAEYRRDMPWHLFFERRSQIDAACGSDGSVSTYSPDLPEATDEITFEAAGEKYLFSARSFFQGNRFLVDKLIETAIGDAEGETALDLYCGVGLFTLPLARRFESVVGVEENPEATSFAERNITNAGLGNVVIQTDSVRRSLVSGNVPKADFVLLDPPRAGTEKETMMALLKLRPERVSYVACEPSILARDLKRFVENGYKIDSITALDLFPQTHHVETVAHLSVI
ncbi:MAG: class I SAM-dependent RNA methyltransferase [Acidobacteria bacterium]|nr:class I SAM-dependent RNA methyltransferase [Acidobacteriota bacterium]